jgi:type I restriction-modification system DNA methylase subunit
MNNTLSSSSRHFLKTSILVETYKNRETLDKYSYTASLEEIAENDYNLNIPRYVDFYTFQRFFQHLLLLSDFDFYLFQMIAMHQ